MCWPTHCMHAHETAALLTSALWTSCCGPWHKCRSGLCFMCANAKWPGCADMIGCAFGEWPMLRPALTEPQEATRDARSTTQTQSRMRHADKHIHTSRMIVLSSARALRNAAQSNLCCRFAAAVPANRTHFCARAAHRSAAARRHHKNDRGARLAEVEQQAVATQRHDLRAVGRASL